MAPLIYGIPGARPVACLPEPEGATRPAIDVVRERARAGELDARTANALTRNLRNPRSPIGGASWGALQMELETPFERSRQRRCRGIGPRAHAAAAAALLDRGAA